MNKKYLIIIVLIAFVLGYLFPFKFRRADPEVIVVTYEKFTDLEMEQGLFEEANSERNRNFIWSDCLKQVAMKKSRDMVYKKYWAHENPATGENEIWDMILEMCGSYNNAGENLIRDLYDPEIAQEYLMDSRLHRKNILDDGFKRMGVGCYKNICTELFTN